MSWLSDLLMSHFALFTLVLARTSGLLMGVPVLGGPDVPMQFRALFAVSLALVIAPTQVATVGMTPDTTLGYVMVLGGELVIGLVLGLAVSIVFSGVQLAGQIIGQLSGMALAEVFNPSIDMSLPLVSQTLYLFALAIFVLIDGHRLVIGGLLETFDGMPPGQGFLSPTIATGLVNLVADSFELGIRAAAPATAALLLSTLVMGLISRTLPQLNILSFGFALSTLVTFGSLALSLNSVAWLIQEYLEPSLETALQALAGG